MRYKLKGRDNNTVTSFLLFLLHELVCFFYIQNSIHKIKHT